MRSSPLMFRTAFLGTLKRLISCSFIVVLRYSCLYWGGEMYFRLPNQFYCIICTNSRAVSRSYNRERYICVSCWYVLWKWCFYNYYYFRCFTYRQELMFFISVRVTSIFFGERNLSLECKPRMLQIIFSHSLICCYLAQNTGVVSTSKVKKTQPSENIFAYLLVIVVSWG